MKNNNNFVTRFIVVLWLTGMIFAYNYFPANPQAGQMIALTWILPFLQPLKIFNFLSRASFRKSNKLFSIIITFLLLILPTAVLSIAPSTSVAYWVITVIGIIICAEVCLVIYGKEIEFLQLYSIIGTLAFWIVIVAVGGKVDQLRNPNGIGLISISLIFSSLAIKNNLIKIFTFIFSTGILLLSHARASSISLVIGVVILTTIKFYCFNKKKESQYLIIVLFIITGCILLLFLAFPNLYSPAWDIISNYLELDNKYTGINSGFTGRTELWKSTLNLWLQSPLFGVGYRVHEVYFSHEIEFSNAANHIYGSSSSHNGYLALLAETGLIGVSLIGYLIFLSLKRLISLSIREFKYAQIGVSFMCAYLFICFFERFLLNFGNPTSVLFLIFIMMQYPQVKIFNSINYP